MSVPPYHIIIAGAGPGDPDLVTVKLVNALKSAEIILVDRLVNPEILQKYSNPSATIIAVGKQGYNPSSTAQEDINEILLESVRSGKKVLRLKGGDVAIYSNVWSEIETLRAHHISYEIIPGITAASGAAAGLNIPLTARTLAAGVQFHTLSAKGNMEDTDLRRWASSPDTLVFYMSVSPIKELILGLLQFNANPDLLVAIVEEATTSTQGVHVFSLKNFITEYDPAVIRTPALVIIGRILDALDRTDLINYRGRTSVFNTLIPPTINTELHAI